MPGWIRVRRASASTSAASRSSSCAMPIHPEPAAMADSPISWADFEKVLIVAGTVTRVEAFPEARKPAYKVWVDFGPHGEKKTSAQIAHLYAPGELVGRQVVGVIN